MPGVRNRGASDEALPDLNHVRLTRLKDVSMRNKV
jgi:hypothetical protein